MFQDPQSGSWRRRRTNGVNSSPKASRLKTQEDLMFQFKSEGRQNADVPVNTFRQEVLCLAGGRVRSFVLFRPSTEWLRATHIKEGNLLYSVYQLKCDSNPKPLTDKPRTTFDQTSAHPMAR